MLADLGADVIKIEKPGGDAARDIGPFYHDSPQPERSLHWFTFNANKRGITLDIQTVDGQDIFKKLVETADFVVECFNPGTMDCLGLGYSALREINPRIIMTSITGFGQEGPYRDYKVSDIVGVALGGIMNVTGIPERAPVRIGPSQAYAQAGAQAAVGTMIAHYHREITGEGQHVDVSLQQCVTTSPHLSQQFWDLEKRVLKRTGAYYDQAYLVQRWVHPCKDGYMVVLPLLPMNYELMVQWMASESMAADLTEEKWRDRELGPGPAQLTQDEVEHFEGVVAEFFKTHTKKELWTEGQRRGVLISPVNTPKDILEDEQLAARNYFVRIEHPELGDTLTYPGPPFRMKGSPGTWQRAPLIGEHNESVYGELGISREVLVTLRQAGVI
jgi:crotonobetainyl-CoA:carnitine CoA-transferase CaiB-like acyl-CoA transferase